MNNTMKLLLLKEEELIFKEDINLANQELLLSEKLNANILDEEIPKKLEKIKIQRKILRDKNLELHHKIRG
ncbi:hypothetical protein [Niallia sp. NCCP-28]|uniref:hypothetical protein n=1 Tax=Niallia sp. NCCP-28 TaxID=2934712 RepID=UPI00207DEB65|nr:hypothetical protein [Niallia sp. NCCP-28]GKU82951.1 hypothetical protein NCCP28_23470 [Niallia sp. NCCP-28]